MRPPVRRGEMLGDEARERRRPARRSRDVRRPREPRASRSGSRRASSSAVVRRRRRVLGAGDHERRRLISAELVTEVPAGQRLAAAGIGSRGASSTSSSRKRADDLRPRCANRREPAREILVGDRLEPCVPRTSAARSSQRLRLAEAGGGASQDEAARPALARSRPPTSPSRRRARGRRRRPARARLVEQREQVLAELRDRAAAALVVRKEPEGVGPDGTLASQSSAVVPRETGGRAPASRQLVPIHGQAPGRPAARPTGRPRPGPSAGLEVGAHSLRIDLEPASARRAPSAAPPVNASAPDRAGHSACQAPRGPLVLLRQRGEQHGPAPFTCRAQATRQHAADRVPLLGHRRRATALGLGHLADLGLAQERHVQADLRDRPGGDARARLRAPRPGPGSCARADRLAQARAPRRAAARPRGPRRRAPRASRPRRRAGRPAAHPGHAPERRASPPERRRASRPPSGRTSSAPPAGAASSRPSASSGAPRRAAAHSAGDRAERLVDQLERPARDQHRRGVEDVLARRAAVDVARPPRLPTASRQSADERLHRVPRRARPASPIAVAIEAFRADRPPRSLERPRPESRPRAPRQRRARARRRASPAATPRPRPHPGPARARRSGRTSSDGEEDGLGLALEPDVELEPVLGRARDERRAVVDARRAPGRRRWPPPRPGSTSASSTGFRRPRANTITIRCGACAVRLGPPGLRVTNEKRPFCVAPRAAPAEIRPVAAVLVRLPDLDHRVRHRLARSVEDPPADTDGPPGTRSRSRLRPRSPSEK